MLDNDYDDIIKLAVDIGTHLALSEPALLEDDLKFHDRLFAEVMHEIDFRVTFRHLRKYEAREVSEICEEVEGDILNGDILGKFR